MLLETIKWDSVLVLHTQVLSLSYNIHICTVNYTGWSSYTYSDSILSYYNSSFKQWHLIQGYISCKYTRSSCKVSYYAVKVTFAWHTQQNREAIHECQNFSIFSISCL